MSIHYPGWVIENVERLATETYKFLARKGKKGNKIWENFKVRCYILDIWTDIHPTEDIVSCTKKVEKKFKHFPKILATEQIDEWMVVISEWRKGIPLDKLPGNRMDAMISYGKFLKGIESLGIYPRDGKWDNVIYNGKHNFSYYCDFGRGELYVEGGNERWKERAMGYKEDFLKRASPDLKKAFYRGYK